MPKVTLTGPQIVTLLAVLHGAQDDDDESDAAYTENLTRATQILREARLRVDDGRCRA